jgi:hypothetical protein
MRAAHHLIPNPGDPWPRGESFGVLEAQHGSHGRKQPGRRFTQIRADNNHKKSVIICVNLRLKTLFLRALRGHNNRAGTSRSTLSVLFIVQDPWPVIGRAAEAFDDRVHPDVSNFQIDLFVVADAVIKEIFLPDDALFSCMESLPVGNDFGHGFLHGKAHKGVQVVGHE